MDEEFGEDHRKQSYRDLRVWQRACDLVVAVYELTEAFPPTERYELTKHMRKTVWSVPTNIAEGCARYRKQEFMHFLKIAVGSLAELDTFIVVAKRLGYGNPEHYTRAESLMSAVGPMLHGLHEKVRLRDHD